MILVSAAGLFDIGDLRLLLGMSRREGLLSAATTLGVLVLGVLPGVVLAVVLSLSWLLATAMRPKDAVLGRLPGLQGYHSIADYPQAETVPGLLLYRFSGNLVFFNIDFFCERVRAAIRRAATPVTWVIVDLSPVSFVDATAVQRFDELREELTTQGVTIVLARVKRQLGGIFRAPWLEQRRSATAALTFPTRARRCRPSSKRRRERHRPRRYRGSVRSRPYWTSRRPGTTLDRLNGASAFGQGVMIQ